MRTIHHKELKKTRVEHGCEGSDPEAARVPFP